jgi:hypothetical protein
LLATLSLNAVSAGVRYEYSYTPGAWPVNGSGRSLPDAPARVSEHTLCGACVPPDTAISQRQAPRMLAFCTHRLYKVKNPLGAVRRHSGILLRLSPSC